MNFPYDFVGANCVRPSGLPEFQAGDQWSPLQKQFIKFALNKNIRTYNFYDIIYKNFKLALVNSQQI